MRFRRDLWRANVLWAEYADGLHARAAAIGSSVRATCCHARTLRSRLRIDGWAINFKPTYRVCRKECLKVRKRRRKKLPVPGLQPLVRRCDRECVRGSALDGHGILMRTRQRS